MTGEQWRLFYAFGGLLFAVLLLSVMPAWVEVVGFAFGLWLCLWVSPFRDTLFVWHNIRRIDREHERL